MILVDSSVWIDYFRDRTTVQTTLLEEMIGRDDIAVGDLILVEVLQGLQDERTARRTERELSRCAALTISNPEIAVEAARSYRFLRARGVTIRKTIDTLIATRCIVDDMPLLYSDRDFDPFVKHLGLRSTLDTLGVN